MPKRAKPSRVRTVARSAKTGRFVKKATAKRHPDTTVVERMSVSGHSVEVVRSTYSGQFVKKSTAKRHPEKTVVEKLER